MKLLFIVCMVASSTCLYSQAPTAPKGDDGNDLFLKGCERVGLDYQACTYCEDKELKKNCVTYHCQESTGKCRLLKGITAPQNVELNSQVHNGSLYLHYTLGKHQVVLAPFKDRYFEVKVDKEGQDIGATIAAIDGVLASNRKSKTKVINKRVKDALVSCCGKKPVMKW